MRRMCRRLAARGGRRDRAIHRWSESYPHTVPLGRRPDPSLCAISGARRASAARNSDCTLVHGAAIDSAKLLRTSIKDVRDLPRVAKGIFHHPPSISIRRIERRFQRRGTRQKRALVPRVRVIDVHV
jgi:hypothetical protein